MWVYDIKLRGVWVGDNGDVEFETEAEALADAHDLILSALEDEFDADCKEFEIKTYDVD